MPSESKKQQRLMGMVHACQKKGKCASKKVKDVAKTIKPKDAEDFAKTKHEGLPEKKDKKEKKMKSFREWVAEKDHRKDEVSTSSGDVASFKARLPIGTVSREWPPKEVLNMGYDKCKKARNRIDKF